MPIPLPPYSEQVAIAELLGSLDDKIELNRRMNETLEAMAQAIFRDWFVDFGPTRRKLAGITDPVEIMGGLVQDAPARRTGALFPDALGDNGLPEGWEERPLRIYCFANLYGGDTVIRQNCNRILGVATSLGFLGNQVRQPITLETNENISEMAF